MNHARRARLADSVVKMPLVGFQVLFVSAFDFCLSPSTARLHRAPGVVPPEGDLHWPPCFAGFFVEGRQSETEQQSTKKDHEN